GGVTPAGERRADPARGPFVAVQQAHLPPRGCAPRRRLASPVPGLNPPEAALPRKQSGSGVRHMNGTLALDLARVPRVRLAAVQTCGRTRGLNPIRRLPRPAAVVLKFPTEPRPRDIKAQRVGVVFATQPCWSAQGHGPSPRFEILLTEKRQRSAQIVGARMLRQPRIS